jgi:shikimate kinase
VLARPDLPELFAARRAGYDEVADVVVATDGLAPSAVAERVVDALDRATRGPSRGDASR